MDTPGNTITICMGSSCFSRGNNLSMEMIRKFLEENGLEGKVEVSGELCSGNCKTGPNIKINGELISGVDQSMIYDLLKHKLNKE